MSMLRELENLLRDIAEQRTPSGANPGTRPSSVPVGTQPVEAQPVDAEIIDAEPVHHWQRNAADQPIHHLDTDDISQHAEQLGEKVGLADENLEARIHDKFDHDLTELDDAYRDGESSDKPTDQAAPALDVAEMLRNPQSIRQAIILSEVLNRPLDRW